MRTEPFKRELQRIRETIYHVFHDHMHVSERTQRNWRPVQGKSRFTARLTIHDAMQTQPITVRPESSLTRALALMIENRISGVPVVDADGMLVGVLTESDVLKIFYHPDVADVASLMTRAPATISLRASLADLVDQLMSSDFRRILVQEDGRLVGVVTRADLMPAILEALAEEALARSAAWRRVTGATETQH